MTTSELVNANIKSLNAVGKERRERFYGLMMAIVYQCLWAELIQVSEHLAIFLPFSPPDDFGGEALI
ncbi:hypothetical protein BG55_05785 [Erwinia mallotivora]|uniref:Uncharacterized protein n=1 Tax=Erwinia mallotivora TaxID=69222 RepID=A0A014NRG1_9GAMM|nr:hypothetical protein BG55_05785 [Erwinia mallotivora]